MSDFETHPLGTCGRIMTLETEIERLTAENERAREIATIHGRRADANLEYAKKCEKLLKRLWIQVNGDDVFLQDAIEGQDA